MKIKKPQLVLNKKEQEIIYNYFDLMRTVCETIGNGSDLDLDCCECPFYDICPRELMEDNNEYFWDNIQNIECGVILETEEEEEEEEKEEEGKELFALSLEELSKIYDN